MRSISDSTHTARGEHCDLHRRGTRGSARRRRAVVARAGKNPTQFLDRPVRKTGCEQGSTDHDAPEHNESENDPGPPAARRCARGACTLPSSTTSLPSFAAPPASSGCGSARVTACFTSSTQQIDSFRARGEMSFQA